MSVLVRLLPRPRALLGVALLLSLLISPLLRRLNLHGDLLDLLPRSSQAAQAFASYSKHMVASQELVVLVTCATLHVPAAISQAKTRLVLTSSCAALT